MYQTQTYPLSRGASSVARGLNASRRKNSRRGVTAVEFAVVAPIFLIMIFGIIEMGRAFMVQQIITNASREGARRAIVEQATAAEVKSLVNDYLAATTVSGVTIEVSPETIGPAIGFGDPVTVSISVPFDSVSWMPANWILGGTELSASTVMRAERPE